MSIQEIMEKKEKLISEINKIKYELATAKFNASQGVYANKVWLIKTQDALRHKQAEIQHLQRLSSETKRQNKQQFQKEFEKFFVDIAKQHLPAQQFEYIAKIAKSLVSSKRNHCV